MVSIAGIKLEGRSTAGIATSIELPEFGVVFDLGCCSDGAFRHSHVFISHGHVDHVAALPAHASIRLLNGLKPARYITSSALAPGLEASFQAAERMAENALPRQLVQLDPGEHELSLRPNLLARAFRAEHRVASQGYLLYEVRELLDARFQALSSREIAALREGGQVVTTRHTRPTVAFSGDTRIEAIENHPDALRSRLLILEATYLDPAHTVEEARRRGHIHLDEIAERADAFQNEAIALTHFSARYRREEIVEWLQKRLPARLSGRVMALV